ncbi:hypothetical protein MY11210_004491 [Beauveria gryllotalpidicola]
MAIKKANRERALELVPDTLLVRHPGAKKTCTIRLNKELGIPMFQMSTPISIVVDDGVRAAQAQKSMEKQALLGGPLAPRREAQRQRPTSSTALFIAVFTFWILLSWEFFTSYGKSWPRRAEPQLRVYAGESIKWRLCGDVTRHDLECGTVDVPMDQFNSTNSNDETFTIPLVRMRSKHASQNLLVNTGGPGASGIGYVYSAGEKLSRLLGGKFHIVGFDPRGIGASTPRVACYVDAESQKRLRPRRTTDLIRDSPYLYAWSANYVRACRENAGQHLQYVNTPQVAADMNSIINALGQKNMFYWGMSYGSLLGQVYATLFPERSERIVIDGVPDQFSWFEHLMDAQRYADTDAVVDGFFEECVRAGDACALSKYGKTGSELRENVTSVINSLYRNPASVYVNGTVYGIVDDFAARITGLFIEMYTPKRWPALAHRLADLQEGNATDMFLTYVNDDPVGNLPAAHLVVEMNDGQSGPTFWPQSRMRLMEKLLPYFDKYRFALGDMLDFHVKQQWDVPRTHSYVPKRRVETATPLLILSTTHDPACPYSAAQAAQKVFVGSRLVALDAYGHASIAMPSFIWCDGQTVDYQAVILLSNMSQHGEITNETIMHFLATVDKVPKPIRQIVRSGEGGEHLVWIINDAFVLRVRADEQDSTLLIREEALWQVLKSIEPGSTVVPICLEIGVWDEVKRPFGLYRKLPGVSIEASPQSVNAATESDLAHMLLLFQKTPIQQARAAGLVDAEPLVLSELRQRARAAWQQQQRSSRNKGHLENLLPRGEDMDQALHISEADSDAPHEPVFLHADLKGEHIFVDPDTGRLAGVIDWSDACVGDPAVDIHGLAISVGAAAAARIAAEAGYGCGVAARGVMMARCDSLICLDAILHQDDDSPEWLVRVQLQRALERV